MVWTNDHQEEGVVCAIADALQPGDDVVVNGRSRRVTVLGRGQDNDHGYIPSSDYPYRIVWLRGNGTEYRLRYSHLGEYYPHLHTESQLKTEESYSVALRAPRSKTYSTERGETVRRLLVEGVARDDLTEWALIRNLDGVEAIAEGDVRGSEEGSP